MDAFAGGYLNGFLREAKLSYILFAALVIAVFNTLAAVVGRLTGQQIDLMLEDFSMPLTIAVLFILGIKMAVKSFRPKFQEMTFELNRKNILAGYAAALSINAFLTGIALSAFHQDFLLFALVFLAVFFFVPLIAVAVSKKSKKFLLAARLEFLGGIVLIGASLFFMIGFFEI